MALLYLVGPDADRGGGVHRGGAARNSVAPGGPSVHHAVRRVHRAPCAVGRPPCGPLGRLRAGAVLSVAGYEQRRLGVYHAGVRVAFAGGIGGAAAAGGISAGKQAAGMAVCRGAAAYPVRRQHGAAGGSADASAAGIPGLVPVGASPAPLAGVGAAWAVRGQYRLCTHLSGHSAAVRQ